MADAGSRLSRSVCNGGKLPPDADVLPTAPRAQARCDLGRERLALQIEGSDEPVVPLLALSPCGIERPHRSDVAVTFSLRDF